MTTEKTGSDSLFDDDRYVVGWLEEIEQLKQEISNIGPARKGSVFQRWHVCGTPNCKCKKDKRFRHGPYYAWTSKEKGKTVTIMIPNELSKEAQDFVNNANLLKDKTRRWSVLSEKIIRRKIKLYRK